jgi:uncharacterized protein YfiM (DUF2279 family)
MTVASFVLAAFLLSPVQAPAAGPPAGPDGSGTDCPGAVQDTPSPLAARAVWLALPAGAAFHEGRPHVAAPNDPWFGPDKILHFGASFLLTVSGQYMVETKMGLPEQRAWPVAAGTSLALGLFKELADSQRERNPLFSWRDMTANALGVGAGVALILL